jgi:hypothetical protein
MIVFLCHVCRTSLSAAESDAGQLQRCPTCKTTLRVPTPVGATAARATVPPERESRPSSRPPNVSFQQLGATGRFTGQRYGFNCPYCSSKLEATGAMAAQEGQCPTCGNQITIPILDRYGRLIDPKTQEIIKQDPHPVHAYAAAGERAPKIERHDDGRQSIVCTRCGAHSPITANNCQSCNMPFTMEGTNVDTSGGTNGFAAASLVLGIIGMGTYWIALPAALGLIFGILGVRQIYRDDSAHRGAGIAIAGIICSGLGLIFTLAHYLF